MQRCGPPLQHSDATVNTLAVSASLPPRVVAVGLARVVRGWQAADVPPTAEIPLAFRPGWVPRWPASDLRHSVARFSHPPRRHQPLERVSTRALLIPALSLSPTTV
jgi:hypothetical protein